jgi:hypothetical protein
MRVCIFLHICVIWCSWATSVILSLACRILSSPSCCPSLSVAVWLNFLPLLPRLRLKQFWRSSSSLCPKLRFNSAVNRRHRLLLPSKSLRYSRSSRWRLQGPLAVRRPCLPRPNQVGDSPMCRVNCLWFVVCYWLYTLFIWQRRSCSALVYLSTPAGCIECTFFSGT